MIEKTKVSGFLHYRTDLGDGVRTGVVFSFCRENCHNFCHSFSFLPEHPFTLDTAEQTLYSEEEMISYLREEKTLCYTKKLGISFLGAEPLQDPFFCKSVAKGIRGLGMDLQIYTCGMCSHIAYDLMDSLVDLYVLRLFSPDDKKASKAISALDLFEKRGYAYRVFIPVIAGENIADAERFSDLLVNRKSLKSVILDFSNSDFKMDEIKSYKESFLKKKIPLYSI